MSENPLRRLREAAGLSMQALADLTGTSAPQINKLEKGERRMTLDWMTRLAAGLGVEIEDLLPAHERRMPAQLAEPRGATPFLPRPPAADPNDLIPVRSAARGGGAQEMFLQDGAIDFIRRPPSLQHVRDAYSIYVVGDSMNPRFRQGQLLHVNPFRPPQPGAGVVVTTHANEVLIKEFVGRTAVALKLRQYNPDLPIELRLTDIRDVHIVVGLDEP